MPKNCFRPLTARLTNICICSSTIVCVINDNSLSEYYWVDPKAFLQFYQSASAVSCQVPYADINLKPVNLFFQPEGYILDLRLPAIMM